jgi:hypothetical protein
MSSNDRLDGAYASAFDRVLLAIFAMEGYMNSPSRRLPPDINFELQH